MGPFTDNLNDKIGYDVAAFSSYVTGYNIDRVEPGKKTSSRFSDSPWSGNYQRGFFRTLYHGLPSTPDMFLSEEREFKEGRRFYSDMVLLELARRTNVNELKRWVNPGNFDLWIFRNLKPYAIHIDDDRFTMKDRYRELSPVRHASKIKAPILIVHGGKDARVGYRHADAMARALDATGAKYELVKRRFLLHVYQNVVYKYEHYVMVGGFLQRHPGKLSPHRKRGS